MLYALVLALAIAAPAASPLATAVPSPSPTVSAAATPLVPALRIDRDGRHLSFVVTVHNTGSAPAELTFSDSGLLQIVVTGPQEAVIYDSRAGRMFAQFVKTIAIAPGETATFREAWDAPANIHGPLNVRATLRCKPPVSVTSTIELE